MHPLIFGKHITKRIIIKFKIDLLIEIILIHCLSQTIINAHYIVEISSASCSRFLTSKNSAPESS